MSQIVLSFLGTPSIRLFESYSRPDLPNRELRTFDEVWAMWQEGGWLHLSAWPEQISPPLVVENISFDPKRSHRLGGKGRTVLHSPTFIALEQGSEQRKGCLTWSTITFWSEIGARQCSILADHILDAVDWKQFSSLTRRIQRRLKAISPAQFGSLPILPDAWAAITNEKMKLWIPPEGADASSPHIRVSNKVQATFANFAP